MLTGDELRVSNYLPQELKKSKKKHTNRMTGVLFFTGLCHSRKGENLGYRLRGSDK